MAMSGKMLSCAYTLEELDDDPQASEVNEFFAVLFYFDERTLLRIPISVEYVQVKLW